MRLVRRISSTLSERRLRREVNRVVARGAGGSAAGGGLYAQFGVGHYGTPGATFAELAILAGVVCAAALGVELLSRLVPRARSAVRARRRKRRRLIAAANVERRTRALMSELCPQGWRAQITLFGPGDAVPPDAPAGERARVALDWAELEDDSGRVAVVRRVWAPTIAEALEAMVADRRTDETLEEIERGAAWPDIYL
jgi:hypothetical protein